MYIWQRVWDRARRRKVIENEQLLHSEWKRRLGVFGLIAIGGVSTLSTVLFVLLPNLFADSGLRAPPLVAVILGVTIHFLSAQQLSFIARVLPKNGHLYQFAFVQHSELLAFAIAWSQLLDYLVFPAILAQALIDHTNLLFQGGLNHLPVGYLSGAVVLIAACFMCCSLRVLSTSGIVFLIASLFTSLSTSVVAFLHNAVNLRIHSLEVPFELDEIHTGISWLLISFLCCESLSFTSEEADNPRKRLPRMFSALSYGNAVVAIFGTLAFFPFAWRQNFTHTSLIPATFDTIKISSARYLMSCGSVFGLTSALLCSFVAPSRLLFTFSSDDLIPGRKVFTSIFGKGGSPRLSVIVTALVASIVTIFLPRLLLCRLLPFNIALRLLCQALLVFVAQFSTEQMNTDVPRYFDFSSRREDSLLQRRDLRSSLGSDFSTPSDDEEETHAMERLWKIDGREETDTRSEKQEESKLLKSDDSGSGSSYGSINTMDESSLTVAPISLQHHNCLLASCAPPDSRSNGRWPQFHIYDAETPQKSRPLTTSSSLGEIGDERAEKRGKRNLTYFIFLSTLIAVSARILWQTEHYVPLLALITLIVSSCLLIGTTTLVLKIHRENGGVDRFLVLRVENWHAIMSFCSNN
ncbi:AA-permease domain-containing protein [Aphelenchoides besseyi]|nr:AA-permease domain-containing protein [Aphelenchoides besseyi]